MKTVIDIERLLHWTYQAQAADAVTKRVVRGLWPSGYGSMLNAVVQQGLLGVRIDCSGPGLCPDDLHPDAEAVHDAVRSLPALQVGLVIEYAKSGLRPDWMEGEEPAYRPILRSNGKPKMEYWDREQKRPAYCCVELVPDPESIAFARAMYEEWWDALATLAAKLDDLEDHMVTGPGFDRNPWMAP
ncbi:conserved protein of unknown function [Magnetospirillum sp. XM-1]|uniref:hypothetical protein n=1 Tax=Magnetospirillum sp. XM-1 TaxID=1663591 RepID=UPI00073DCF87|nr:hypothetical protein [Magnetospirillum sp. XM-1]CUW39686.1 conserved protein of unknown function [Magnetospirillum sp. XM-1]